jgi:hypothetical protein
LHLVGDLFELLRIISGLLTYLNFKFKT